MYYTLFFKNIRTYPSHKIFVSDKKKEFVYCHIKKGRYKVKVFKDPFNENYSIYSRKSKSNIKYKGYMPYPLKLEDRGFLYL